MACASAAPGGGWGADAVAKNGLEVCGSLGGGNGDDGAGGDADNSGLAISQKIIMSASFNLVKTVVVSAKTGYAGEPLWI